jgi:hypothetical protein
MKIKIVDKKPAGDTRGKKRLYDFSKLKVGQCMQITPSKSDTDSLSKLRNSVATSLYQYIKSDDLDWETTVRIEERKVNVYRTK